MSEPPRTRRAEYAEATRNAIVTAARELYARQGYFATTVEDIARQARVAPATVYAVGGGKQGLLRTLTDLWSQAPIVAEAMERQSQLTDPGEILRYTAGVVRSMRQDYGDIMRVVLATAPNSPEAGEALRLATDRYRAAVATVAAHLHETGGLHPDMTTRQATDILWFFFGYTGLATLTDDNAWTYEQAEHWLVQQATTALRTPP
ncbi:TetR/AcrR family transcriptional regulator [Streptomyces iconiensis]|uniref:Helix-turn-helix domain-containing protein n=1 Tax=Streptomyces iconiensis TaxID=1384038 RepID=A0ABT7A380_9ACTN|nr:TetR/AcrR family transcriptional regulator [Streptomyces iconiensis]MDJ1135764.1 helix-turn-helix domain-containing protein [Streptomyces iconiensis]